MINSASNFEFGACSKRRALLEKLLQQEKSASTSPSAIPRRRTTGSAMLSFAQERLWFLDQLEPGSALYNIPMGLRLRGALNRSALERCLKEIVRRHEVLRTHFEMVEGQARQVIEPVTQVEIVQSDLGELPEPEKEAEARRLCMEEAQRPFDLARGPLLRARLLCLGAKEHIFLLVLHHIASDGWSMSVLIRELRLLYQAFCVGKHSPLPELPIQYADYALWQRDSLRGKVLERQINYWKQRLVDAPRSLELPTDRRRPASQNHRGAHLSVGLPQPLLSALRKLSRRERVSLFMTLLSAFQTLLHRYSGAEDIVIGSAIAGRNRPELENLMGFFVNTLVLRGDLSGNPTFRALLERIREVSLEAYAHQDLPFEKLVEVLRPERELSHSPLFHVMFVLQNTPLERVQLADLEVTPIPIEGRTAKFDLTFSITECGEALQAAVEYNTDLFEAETVRRMLNHYQKLLEAIVANPEQRLSDLPMLTEPERHQVLVEWNDTAREYPRDKCIHQLFEAQVEHTPDAVAVVFEDQSLTYRELNERTNQLAHHLRNLDVGPDTPIGVCLGRSLEYIVCVLAILKAGGAYVPLDRGYPPERLQFMLKDCRAPVVLTDQPLPEDLELPGTAIVDVLEQVEQIKSCSKDNPATLNTARNLAYVIYTSGSTGQPKGTTIPHRGVVRLVRGQNYATFDIRQRFLLLASTSFDASTFELWGALLNGARCIIYPEALPDFESLEKTIRQHGVTCLFLTTALFNQIIDFRPAVLETVSHVLTGGEAHSVPHMRKALDRLPRLRLTSCYGPTECTTFTTTYPVRREEGFQTGLVPIGRPIANTRVYVLDRNLQPVPVGVTGQLYIGGDGLARGYLNRPELTAKKFVSNPLDQDAGSRLYATGDLVRWLPDGNLEFLGRIDQQVKIRGFRVELGEIESALTTHPGVREAVVAAREDDPGEKLLVAYVVSRNGEVRSSELRNFLQGKLPDYMVPTAFVALDTLPLTPNGKINRKALPRPEPGKLENERSDATPRDYLEQALSNIWSDVLNLKEVGVRDNFFELGGHSLLAIRLIGEINRILHTHLQVTALFQNPTIEQLAAAISKRNQNRDEDIVYSLNSGETGLPVFFIGPIHREGFWDISLAWRLSNRYSVFATDVRLPPALMRAQAMNPKAHHLTVERTAAHHAALIRSQHLGGPCVLAGYSFAGTVAFETAYQLCRTGIKVAAVFLLDTWMARPNRWWRIRLWFLRRAEKSLNQGLAYFWRASKRRFQQVKSKWQSSRQSAVPSTSLASDFNLVDCEVPWAVTARAIRRALRAYRPQPLACRGVLFRCSGEDKSLRKFDDSRGAKELFKKGFRVIDVPGTHRTMFHQPHLDSLTQRFGQCLEQLQHESQI